MISILDQPLASVEPSSEEEKLLSDIQGNILKFHNRRFAVHLFLNFRDVTRAKGLVREFSSKTPKALPFGITDGLTQIRDGELFRKSDGKESRRLVSLSLSYAGYVALDISLEAIPDDPAFRTGMLKRGPNWLGDASHSNWDDHFKQPLDSDTRPLQQGVIHAMVLIADNDRSVVEGYRSEFINSIGSAVEVLGEEWAEQIYDRTYSTDARPIEHFGYVDNISGPIFFAQDKRASSKNWNPLAPLSLALKQCLSGANVGYGSYLVFRKLEQNVRAFAMFERQLALDLCITQTNQQLNVGALLIGRKKDGSPLVGSGAGNDFNFDSDGSGTKCPFTAHIRKVNPRGSSDPVQPDQKLRLSSELKHMIARRGITYGERRDHLNPDLPPAERPDSGVGLLFMCYQSSIIDQFEHMQRNWANNEFFPILPSRGRVGKDALIGQGGSIKARFASSCEGNDIKSLEIPLCIGLKGGEFLFTPSISFLRNL